MTLIGLVVSKVFDLKDAHKTLAAVEGLVVFKPLLKPSRDNCCCTSFLGVQFSVYNFAILFFNSFILFYFKKNWQSFVWPWNFTPSANVFIDMYLQCLQIA